MDPGRPARRAGLFTFLILLTLLSHPTVATIESSHATRAVRPMIIGSKTLLDLSAGKPEDGSEEPGESLWPKTERGGCTTTFYTGAYLPVTGALPLRFAEPRRWPNPLPKPSDESALPDERPTGHVAARNVGAEDPTLSFAEPFEQDAVTTSAGAVGPATPDPLPRIPAVRAGEAIVITAEMVTAFLEGIDAIASTGNARFRPAVPRPEPPAVARAATTP